MLKLVVYLLPLSGSILIDQLQNSELVEVELVFLPETFVEESREQINFLKQNDIPYLIPEDLSSDRVRDKIEGRSFDLGLSIGYDKKLPDWLIRKPEMNTVNIHPSLLPDYRGANPYFWAIKNQETTTGTSLHLMDENFDTGPILRKEQVQLRGDETLGELFFELNELGCDMAMELLDEIVEGGMPEAQPQPEADDRPGAPRVTERHLRIDWDQPYKDVEAHVRAANPFFGAQTTFRGANLKIYEIARAEKEEPASPGSIETTSSGPIVRCKDAWARLETVRMGHFYVGSGKMFQQREENALNVLSKVI